MNVELVAKTKPVIEGVDLNDFSAYVARIGKVKDNPGKLVKYLVKHAHWSPFEHGYLTFKIETSRAIGRELLRHRSFTFQELSQRYEAVMEFEPIELRKQSEDNRQSSTEVFDPIIFDDASIEHEFDTDPNIASYYVEDVLAMISDVYQELLRKGVARECARMILPECTKTTLLVTGNIRSWIHFLAIRNEERAQKEMQLISQKILGFLATEIPLVFDNKEE